MSPLTDPAGRRLVWSGSVAAVASLLGYGYYLQYVEYLDPCPLCITQRLFYMGIGAVSLAGLLAIRSGTWQRVAGALYALFALGGVVTAGRQVWLQHLPPEAVPECGPGLQYWLDNESALSVLRLLFAGDGNCAEVQWTFLTLSIGEWSLGWFVAFLLVGVALAVRTVRAAPVASGTRDEADADRLAGGDARA